MRYLRLFLFLLLCLMLNIQVFPQSAENPELKVTDRFSINNPLEVDLSFDFKTFLKNKDEDEYMPATIAYSLDDGTMIEKHCRIRPRGNYRRNKCYLPPIKIDFDDSSYHVDEFENMGSIKMVSLCNQASNFEQYLIKEYLAYKAYELLSEYSFKTYFMKVNFVDTEGKKKTFSSYSFLIEDIDDLAERKNAMEIENTGLLPVHMQRDVMNQLGVFQFMIGNTDWHMPNLHNIKLLKITDTDHPLPIPVPYDFDYSGIVNTNYAVPHESVPIESITERYYMGNCMSESEFAAVRENFMELHDEIIALFADCSLLQTFNQKTAVSYIEDFYAILENDKLVKQWLFAKCD